MVELALGLKVFMQAEVEGSRCADIFGSRNLRSGAENAAYPCRCWVCEHKTLNSDEV